MNAKVRAWREHNEIYRLDFGATTERVKTRAINTLARNGVTTLRGLVAAYEEGTLAEYRGLGEKGFVALEEALARHRGPIRRWVRRLRTKLAREEAR